MAENRHDVDRPDIERPEVLHETSDVNAWSIGKFAIALALVCVASMAILLALFHYFITQEGPMPQKAYSALSDAKVKLPPSPDLEVTEYLDLASERAAEDAILNSYGWIDKQKGVVRIPIAKAIDLLAQKGLPSRTAAPAVSNASVPTESGLGPVVQQAGGPPAGGGQ